MAPYVKSAINYHMVYKLMMLTPWNKNHPSLKAAFISTLLALVGVSNCFAVTGHDVITMKNGDIHNGTAAREQFGLKTAYGNITIPYSSMRRLSMGNEGGRDVITTRTGERFSGRITDEFITTMRQSGPTLPLSVNDIAEIDFAPLPGTGSDNLPPDAIETEGGDRFGGWIITGDYLVQGAGSISMLKRDALRFIDLDPDSERSDGNAQVTTRKKIIQGRLLISSLRVKTRYGQALGIPLTMLNTLAFDIAGGTGANDFQFRRQVEPASLIHDRMIDGTPAPLMVQLPGGSYRRGDLQGDGDSDEQPPLAMRIKPFAIGMYEITFDEYELFCRDTGRDHPGDEGWGRGRRPVINVSWEDATAYTRWLSRRTGQRYRLPSDAEWEYAARANSSSRYWWGEVLDQPRANCEGCGSIWDGEKSSLVGRFSPNSFGLHDTAGNVFEWVADCLHEDFSTDPTDGSPVDRPDCGKRIIRGGAWSFPPKEIRSANRWRDFPTRRSDDTGFRVARDLE
jgi:formylglycine-generating enzyme required for sulfatase activity